MLEGGFGWLRHLQLTRLPPKPALMHSRRSCLVMPKTARNNCKSA